MARAARGRGSRNRRAAPSPRAPRRAGSPRSRRSPRRARCAGSAACFRLEQQQEKWEEREGEQRHADDEHRSHRAEEHDRRDDEHRPAGSLAHEPAGERPEPDRRRDDLKAQEAAVAAERVVGGPERELRERGHVAPPRARCGREQDRVRRCPWATWLPSGTSHSASAPISPSEASSAANAATANTIHPWSRAPPSVTPEDRCIAKARRA